MLRFLFPAWLEIVIGNERHSSSIFRTTILLVIVTVLSSKPVKIVLFRLLVVSCSVLNSTKKSQHFEFYGHKKWAQNNLNVTSRKSNNNFYDSKGEKQGTSSVLWLCLVMIVWRRLKAEKKILSFTISQIFNSLVPSISIIWCFYL